MTECEGKTPDDGNEVYFTNTACLVYNRKGQQIAIAELVNGVHKLVLGQDSCMLNVSGEMCHRRLAHINSLDLHRIVSCVDGEWSALKKKSTWIGSTELCVAKTSNQDCLLFPVAVKLQKCLLDLVHEDVCKPFP